MTTTADKIAALRERICDTFNAAADLRDALPKGTPEKKAVRSVAQRLDRAMTDIDDMLDEMGLML